MMNTGGVLHGPVATVGEAEEGKSRAGRWRTSLLVVLTAVLLALVIQWRSGAFRDDFSATGDEVSHFTTSVAIGQWLKSGEVNHPIDFFVRYYLHYPKLGLGKWPPAFHVVAGLWFLAFGASRFSAMLWLAVQMGLLAGICHRVALRLLAAPLAVAAALTVPLTPLLAEQGTMFMVEIQLAALGLAALLCFHDFLLRPGWWSGALFVVTALAAVYTKANGWAVLLACGCIFLWRWSRAMVRPAPVIAALGLVALIGTPFYAIFFKAMSDGNYSQGLSWDFTTRALPRYSQGMLSGLGVCICAFFLYELWRMWRGSAEPSDRRLLIGVLAFGVGGPLAFQSVVPASYEIRHLCVAIPCMVLLAFAGLQGGLTRFGGRVVSCGGAALLLATVPWTMPERYSELNRQGARLVEEHLSQTVNRTVFISSDSNGEGRLIASLVALDPGARVFCVRASKVVADTNWDSRRYKLRLANEAAVAAALDHIPVCLAVVHSSGRAERPHNELARRALTDTPGWKLVETLASTARPSGTVETLRIYERTANASRPVQWLEVDVRNKIGRVLAIRDGKGRPD